MNKKTILAAALAAATVSAGSAADTWRWVPTTEASYGYSAKSSDNWVNVATGENGLPVSGDFVIVTGQPAFGSDFGTSLAFGGVFSNNQLGNGEFVSQGTLTLQAGGAGIVLSNGTWRVGTANGSIAFTGSGEGIIDIENSSTRLTVQKSLYGNANITLVKRGAGTLQANDGYAPLNSAKTAYSEARNNFGNYYQFRKFVFGGVKLQGGTLDMRQYYWVSDCDFQFDGDGTKLALTKFSQDVANIHSLELSNCRIRETENVTLASHVIDAPDARCFIHMFGDKMQDSSFSGQMTGKAGLVWSPGAAATFTFSKSISPTTGLLVISNGTVKVTAGAGLPFLSQLVIDGESSVLDIDESASGLALGAVTPVTLANGGKIALGGAIRVAVASVTVDGEAIAAGYYSSVAGAKITAADWLTGTGVLRVGTLPEGDATATWIKAGATTISDPSNWEGGVTPDLDNAATFVTVASSVGNNEVNVTLDRDVWLRGLDAQHNDWVDVKGTKKFSVGSQGLKTGTGRRIVLEAPTRVTATQTWTIRGNGGWQQKAAVESDPDAALTVSGDPAGWIEWSAACPALWGPLMFTNMSVRVKKGSSFGPKSAPAAILNHAGNGNSPTFESGAVIDRDLWIYDTSCAKQGYSTITVSTNGNLTFNGSVASSNTCTLALSLCKGGTVTFNDLFMSRNAGSISGDGTAIFNGPCHFRDRLTMSGACTVELHATQNRVNGNMGDWSSGTIKTCVPYALEAKNTIRQATDTTNNSSDGQQRTFLNPHNLAVLDLCGNDQSVGHLALHGGGGTVTSATAATLHIIRTDGYWASHNYSYGFSVPAGYSTANFYGYENVDRGYWTGGVSLKYEATSPKERYMTRESTSTGNVEVVKGLLVFQRQAKTAGETFILKGTTNIYPRASTAGSWVNASAAIVRGGTLQLEHGKVFGKQTAVVLDGDGVMQLDEGVVQKVASLTIGGERMPDGFYGSSESSAPAGNQKACFTGKGVLRVGKVGLLLIVR